MISAQVSTPRAAASMRKLCRHFGHHVPTELTETHGWVQFPFGRCDFEATPEVLTMRLQANDEASLARVQEVIESHLVRFSPDETLQIQWLPAADPV